MTPFLKQVAGHYFEKPGIDKCCFVFPNRRAASFFKKFLGEYVSQSGKPIVAPSCYTMNDFLYLLSGKRQTDNVVLLVELYECYKKLNPKAEELDDFLFWGGVLLSDFNDVDKYLCDPASLFTNVKEFKAIDKTHEYLSQTQIDALEHFASHFKTGGSYKDKFLGIWKLLYPLYKSFNETLDEKGLCYEGQAYRHIADLLSEKSIVDILPKTIGDNIVFVGLNALNECEKKVLKALRNANLAEFCWDYSSDWIRDSHNKSSFFLQENVDNFPQAFKLDTDGLPTPEFNVLSVPSSIGQAKQLPGVIERLGGKVGIDTAIVLPDENLLLPVLNSIPEKVDELNVTMGYSLNGTELAPLMNDICSLQLRLREKDDKWYFYHKLVWAVLSSSLVRSVLDEESIKKIAALKKEARYYLDESSFGFDPLISLIFTPVVKDVDDPGYAKALSQYLSNIVTTLASRIKDDHDMYLELDFARAYYRALGRLDSIETLVVKPATFVRLLRQIAGIASVPFHGEPLKGLQIMGPLETRALDFDNVVILSCNEGVFPRRAVASSFIPAELRKGFGLPTYEFQDAVWAYYFYRLVQRASKVWLLYDSRPDVSRSAEPSRYVAQLEMDYGVKMNKFVMSSPIGSSPVESQIEKTQEDISKIKALRYSASSLQDYLSCPAKFYYGRVCKLKADQEVSESLDAGMLGTAFHRTMEELYDTETKVVTKSYLKELLKSDRVKETVRRKILELLKSFEISGKNILYEDIIIRYVFQTIRRDIELMESYKTDSIRILGLERDVDCKIDGFTFTGQIDRLDSLVDSEVRVVDYKTGKVTDNDIFITDDNAQEVVDQLFGDDNKKRPKIALQLYLYDRFAKSFAEVKGSRILNSIYGAAGLFVDPVQNVELSVKFTQIMDEKLKELLSEISDIKVPFRRCDDPDTCKWCDFKQICGR